MKVASISSKIKNFVTNRKPDFKIETKSHSFQGYGDIVTIGIKTGIQRGPHYGGKGEIIRPATKSL
jgi:hypothetical protein